MPLPQLRRVWPHSRGFPLPSCGGSENPANAGFMDGSVRCVGASWKCTRAPLGVALGDRGEDRSSGALAFWSLHMVIHFVWSEKWPKVKMYMDPRAEVRSSLQAPDREDHECCGEEGRKLETYPPPGAKCHRGGHK